MRYHVSRAPRFFPHRSSVHVLADTVTSALRRCHCGVFLATMAREQLSTKIDMRPTTRRKHKMTINDLAISLAWLRDADALLMPSGVTLTVRLRSIEANVARPAVARRGSWNQLRRLPSERAGLPAKCRPPARQPGKPNVADEVCQHWRCGHRDRQRGQHHRHGYHGRVATPGGRMSRRRATRLTNARSS